MIGAHVGALGIPERIPERDAIREDSLLPDPHRPMNVDELNRSLLVVKPRQPYLDWRASSSPAGS